MSEITKRGKGRPKQFNREEALLKAQQVFCELGYEGASLSKLTKSMGINSPSLYSEFGSKQALFLEVLDVYHAPYRQMVKALFESHSTVIEAVKQFLEISLDQHSRNNALGCLIVNSSINSRMDGSAITTKIKELHDRNEELIFERLERAQQTEEISSRVNIRSLSRFLNGVAQGAAILARGQQSKDAVKDLLSESFELFELRIETT